MSKIVSCITHSKSIRILAYLELSQVLLHERCFCISIVCLLEAGSYSGIFMCHRLVYHITFVKTVLQLMYLYKAGSSTIIFTLWRQFVHWCIYLYKAGSSTIIFTWCWVSTLLNLMFILLYIPYSVDVELTVTELTWPILIWYFLLSTDFWRLNCFCEHTTLSYISTLGMLLCNMIALYKNDNNNNNNNNNNNTCMKFIFASIVVFLWSSFMYHLPGFFCIYMKQIL